MKIKSEKDFWSGIMFMVVGITFAVGATNYSMGTSARPGPGYFPLMLSIILAILGAIVLFKSLTIETEGGDKIGHIAWRPLLVVVGSIALFAILLPRLGMFISIPILIVTVSFAGDEFKWKGVVIAAIVLTIFSWAVFVKGLGLTIPVAPSFMAT
ncbi:tripartite tricarboxylate transporter TctB family protein [Piscinibacter sp. HJYY11]|uniref:tripartite tricarboxylate transporter TctB family protein n=1 Tax=Piscinibacter sp. HJYY11 TaxID=2801333 RepID=UPI00191EAB62|nr:tripartite tricarboxylate transporter TctB family protein [Piscinibacter sp. HJYY11]MBL0727501.1 tripartite tricarboxylate transporter TctB family protein [Piscinibacter sp. HJYY11]